MTEAQYFQKVAKIEQLNKHHELLPKLKSRFSLVHAQYVDIILKQLLEAFTPQMRGDTEGVTIKVQKVVNQSVLQSSDAVFKGLLGKKYTIRTRLNVTVNKFHSCTSNQARKEVSISVNEIENELRDLQNDIDYYERNRRLPPVLEDENARDFFLIPDTIEAIEKRLNVCDVSITKFNKQLEAFDFKVINDSSHPQHKKYQKAESMIKKWKDLRLMLKSAREKLRKKDEVQGK